MAGVASASITQRLMAAVPTRAPVRNTPGFYPPRPGSDQSAQYEKGQDPDSSDWDGENLNDAEVGLPPSSRLGMVSRPSDRGAGAEWGLTPRRGPFLKRGRGVAGKGDLRRP